jgi:hypothetical protein
MPVLLHLQELGPRHTRGLRQESSTLVERCRSTDQTDDVRTCRGARTGGLVENEAMER